jgi:hypothetical protein
MTKDLMAQYAGRTPVVEKCMGCDRIVDQEGGKFCAVYDRPWYKWSVGACNMATHVKSEVVQQAKALNPLKASKLKARGRG